MINDKISHTITAYSLRGARNENQEARIVNSVLAYKKEKPEAATSGFLMEFRKQPETNNVYLLFTLTPYNISRLFARSGVNKFYN